MGFQGFGPKALPFFKALKFHQSREWFDSNRETYESAVKGPMGDLVEDVAERLRKAKIPIEDLRSSLIGICAYEKRKSQSKATASLRRSESIATSGSPPTRTLTRHMPASC